MGNVYDLFLDDEDRGAGNVDSLADRFGVPAPLARALMGMESGGRADAVSPKGARGRFQVMPGTLREMGVDPASATPEQMDEAGLGYLRKQYDRFGRWDLALAAYHAGPGSIRDGRIPDTSDGITRTPDYVKRILGAAERDGTLDAPEPRQDAARAPRNVFDMLLEGRAPVRDDFDARMERAKQSMANAPVGLIEEAGRGARRGLESLGAGASALIGRDSSVVASDLADVAQVPRSAAQQQYEEQLKTATEGFDRAQGFAESTGAVIDIIKAVFGNPTQAARATAESLAASSPAFVGAMAGAGAGALAGPAGSVIGGLVGFLGGSLATNTQVEMASRLDEKLRERGVDTANVQQTIAALEQNPTIVSDARSEAIAAGLATTGVEATVDLATFGLARVTKPARSLIGTAVRATGAVGMQGVGEGLGAYAGDLAAGDEPSAGGAIAEGLMGLIPGVPEAGAAVYAGRKLPLAAALADISAAKTTEEVVDAAARALDLPTVSDGLTPEQREERELRMGEARLRGLNLVDDAQALAPARAARDEANRVAGSEMLGDAQDLAAIQDNQRALRETDARAAGSAMLDTAQEVAGLRRMNRDADARAAGAGMVDDAQFVASVRGVPSSLIGGAMAAGEGTATLPRESTAVEGDGDWRAFGPESGSMGVPRADMPQIRPETHGPLVNFLKARGVESTLDEVPAGRLRPTQAEYSPAKVESARDAGAGEKRVLVSSDGYVVDGHHRWLAAFLDDAPVKVIRLDAPVRELLDLVREFPSAGQADGGMASAAPTGMSDIPPGVKADIPPSADPARAAAEAKRDDAIARLGELLGGEQPAPGGLISRAVDEPVTEPEPRARERTPAQLAAQKAKREGYAQKNPFLSFLGRHGVSMALQKDIVGETGRRGNRMIPYHGPLFRRDGLNIDLLAERAIEAGFLSAADLADETDFGGTRKLADMILRAFQGERVLRPEEETAALEQEMRDAYQEFADTEAEQDGGAEPVDAPEVEDTAVALADAFDEDEMNALLAEVGYGAEELDDAQLEAIADDGLAALIADAEADGGAGAPAEAVAAPADEGADARRGDEGDAPGPQGLIEQAAADAPPTDDFALAAQTPDELRAADEARRRTEAEQRRRDEAPPPEEFVLTGSDRPADQASARGQTDLFGTEPPAERPALTPPSKAGAAGLIKLPTRPVDGLEAERERRDELRRRLLAGDRSVQEELDDASAELRTAIETQERDRIADLDDEAFEARRDEVAEQDREVAALLQDVFQKLRSARRRNEAALIRELEAAADELQRRRDDLYVRSRVHEDRSEGDVEDDDVAETSAAPSPASATSTTEKEPAREREEGDEAAEAEVLRPTGGDDRPPFDREAWRREAEQRRQERQRKLEAGEFVDDPKDVERLGYTSSREPLVPVDVTDDDVEFLHEWDTGDRRVEVLEERVANADRQMNNRAASGITFSKKDLRALEQHRAREQRLLEWARTVAVKKFPRDPNVPMGSAGIDHQYADARRLGWSRRYLIQTERGPVQVNLSGGTVAGQMEARGPYQDMPSAGFELYGDAISETGYKSELSQWAILGTPERLADPYAWAEEVVRKQLDEMGGRKPPKPKAPKPSKDGKAKKLAPPPKKGEKPAPPSAAADGLFDTPAENAPGWYTALKQRAAALPEAQRMLAEQEFNKVESTSRRSARAYLGGRWARDKAWNESTPEGRAQLDERTWAIVGNVRFLLEAFLDRMERAAQSGQPMVQTEGTRVQWAGLAGWIDALTEIRTRRETSSRTTAVNRHYDELERRLDALVGQEQDLAVLGRLRNALGKMPSNPTSEARAQRVKVLDAISRRENELGKAAASNKPTLQPPRKARDADAERYKAAQAKAAQAIDDLANLLGGKKFITPEQQKKLLPILVDLMDALATMGAIKFRELAGQVLDIIRAKLGPDVADQITLRDLQSAYLSVGQNHEGSDEPASVFTVQSLDELPRGAQDGAEGTSDAPGSDPDLERDRLDAADGDEAVGTPVPAGAGGARGGAGGRGGSAGGGRRSGPRDPSLPGPGTTTGREPRGDAVRGGDQQPLPSDLPPGVDESERVDDPRDSGVPPDAEGADGAAEPRRDPSEVDRARAQREAEGTRVKLGDRANIDETLPYLTDGQRADVKFAEDRFAKADGHGVLFTNGTGTGKTFTGLGVAKRFAARGRDNILIVVPSQTIASDWAKSGKALLLDVAVLADTKDNGGAGPVVTTYANLAANNALVQRKWDLVIADEAHKLSENANGDATEALHALRALTGEPRGKFLFATKRYPDEYAAMAAASQALSAANRTNDTPMEVLRQLDAEANRTRAAWDRAKAKADAEFDRIAENRPKVTFLSATPFAYEKNTDWASGYLYDYAETFDGRTGYNSGSDQAQFMIRHFGYRMRVGKLTEPGPEVDRGLMQRAFNSYLKKQGVLSGRTLDVPFDYDRRFQSAESGIGNRIDQALDWLNKNGPGRFALREMIDAQFDHLTRRRILEGIKAEEVVPYIRAHLDAGRKVLVFHDYRSDYEAFHPFKLQIAPDATDSLGVPLARVYDEFKREFKDLIAYPFERQRTAPETLQAAFPDVLLFNGAISTGERRKAKDLFNDTSSGRHLILVQSAAGREGISLHDTTGEMQRVLIHLGLPTAPTAAIQQEGRIMRFGQASNAMFRYLNTGTSWERWAFATTIARRASAAENMAQGEEARGLLDSFVTAFEASGDFPPGHESEGKGGKLLDRALAGAISLFERAKSYYFAQPKKNARTKSREGVSYFATPEPLGLKMVEWAGQPANARFLEPSAGHGAIARWFPDLAARTAVEPSAELGSRLALAFDGRIVRDSFESLDTGANKFEAIVMNPPFNGEGGVGGKLAAEHLTKAWKHLVVGGRIVAIVPNGPSMDKRLDAFYEFAQDYRKDEGLELVADIKLPTVSFERAGTSVSARVLVLQKHGPGATYAYGQPVQRDYSDVETIGEFFDRIEQLDIRPVPQPEPAADAPTAAPVSASAPATSVRDVKTWEQAHGRTGDTQFMAAPGSRVDDVLYRKLADLAKKHGGYYSRYQNKAQGVKAGFVFKTALARQAWIDDARQAMGERPAMNRQAPAASASARRGMAVGGMPIRRLVGIVDRLRGKWANAPDIEVVATAADLPDRVQAEIGRQESGGAEVAPQGVYWNGTVYLVADQLATEQDVVTTLMHEATGHFGLRGVFGDRLNAVLDRVALARPQQMREKARDYGLSLADVEQRRAVAEEILAEMAGESPTLSLVQRAIAAIRQWVRNMLGIDLELSDADLVAQVILPARQFVERGRAAPRDVAEGSPAGARGPSVRTLLRRFGQQPESAQEAARWLSDGWRVFVAHEMDEGAPIEVKSVERLLDYTYAEDQMIGLPPGAGSDRPAMARPPRAAAAQPADDRSSYLGALTPEQERAARNVGLIKPRKTLRERMDKARERLGVRLRQGIVDQFAAIKDVDQRAYVLARMTKGSDGTLEALMLYGKPFLRDDVPDVRIEEEGGFAKVLADLKGEHDRFLLWVAAKRAERLKAEGRENLFTDDDISALKTLDANDATAPDRRQRFAGALMKLNRYNDAVLKVAFESGLIDDEALGLFRDQPYVPFYRVMEDENAPSGPRFSSGLVNQYAYKKLKGGDRQLNQDLLANIVQNWSHLLAASARNRAAARTIGAAQQLGIVSEAAWGTKGTVKVMEAGVAKLYTIDDPMLYEAVSAMEWSVPSWFRPFSTFKRWLTIGVTANPAFKIRNLIRDSLSAISQNELRFNPVANVTQGFKATGRDSQTFASMLASGGVIRFGSMIEGDRAHHAHRLIGKAAEDGTLLDESGWKRLRDKVMGVVEAYNELGDRAENANRAALYEQLRAKGSDHADASFMARDLMDFSMSGRWPIVRFLVQTVPFMNARLQGLYKLGRSAAEDPKRFAYMAGAVSLASLALLWAYGDDDDWKKREDWDRDANWWFKIGDTAFRIPKPFELGAIGTLVERTWELAADDEMTWKRYGGRLSAMAAGTFALSPVPQIVKPMVDVYANQDAFTGRPIESFGMERLRPQDRYTERTSEVAKLLGQLGLPDPAQLAMGRYKELSPVQMDALLRGYFGWVGTSVATALDYGIRPLLDGGERPDMRLRDVFLAGNFVESLPAGSSRYVTQLYEQSREVEQAYASYREALKRGDPAQAREILEAEREKIARRETVNRVRGELSDIATQMRRVQNSPTMPGEEKRRRLDELERQRDRLARQAG